MLVLASKSAARRAMLTDAGIVHDVVAPRLDEAAARAALKGHDARTLADALAELKALKISRQMPGCLVLGCDQTLERDDGQLLDQPGDAVADQLHALSGRSHRLFAAVVAARDGVPLWRHVGAARLTMRSLSTDFIEAYVAAEGPMVRGCVGGYRIEGPGIQLFDRIDGDHFTIRGLPLLPLLGWLRVNGIVQS